MKIEYYLDSRLPVLNPINQNEAQTNARHKQVILRIPPIQTFYLYKHLFL